MSKTNTAHRIQLASFEEMLGSQQASTTKQPLTLPIAVRGEDRVLAHEVRREHGELCHFRRNDANLETFRLLCAERGEDDRVL